jgi:hypothetical protein
MVVQVIQHRRGVCPIVGAGGSGGTCTVTAVGGALTGCSAIGGGTNYADERIVKIGGRSEAAVTVDVRWCCDEHHHNRIRGCGYSVHAPDDSGNRLHGCTDIYRYDVTAGGVFP